MPTLSILVSPSHLRYCERLARLSGVVARGAEFSQSDAACVCAAIVAAVCAAGEKGLVLPIEEGGRNV